MDNEDLIDFRENSLPYDLLENKDKEETTNPENSSDNDHEYFPNGDKKPELRIKRLRKKRLKKYYSNYCEQCSGHLDKEEDLLKHKKMCVPPGRYLRMFKVC